MHSDLATKKRACGVAILVVFLSIPPLVSALSLGFYPVQADETTLAWAGARALKGDVPYRDYFSILPPGTICAVAGWFRAFGVSLAALRFMEIAVSALSSALLFFLLIKRASLTAAFSASLLVPWLFFKSWPVPSHHYFAVAAALAAITCAGSKVGKERDSNSRLVAAGFACALTFLTLQPEGALVTGWIIMDEFFEHANPRLKLRRLSLFSAGFILPVAVSAVFLIKVGAFRHAFYDILVWPARYYRQAGGFNDLPFLRSLVRRLSDGFSGAGSIAGFMEFATLAAGMAIVFACTASVICRAAAGRRRGDLIMAAKLALLFALLLRGRSEWVHLAMWCPFLILLGIESWEVEPAGRQRWLHPIAIIHFGIAVSAVAWAAFWVKTPPDPRDIVKVDTWYSACGPAGAAKVLQSPEKMPPVLYLPHGSAMYLFYAPDPPPLDWVMPPSKRCSAPWELEMLARWCKNREVPFVLLGKGYEKMFLREPSALSEVLSRDYDKRCDLAWGLLLERKRPLQAEGHGTKVE